MSVERLRSDWLNGAVVAEISKSPTLQNWLLDLQEDLRNIHAKQVELDEKVNPAP